jgi:hypothetical protein
MGFSLKTLWRSFWIGGSPQFVLEFSGGQVTVVEGRAPRTFTQDCQEIAREHQIRDGWVAAVGPRDQTRLVFSRSLPDSIRQRLRNAWSFSTRR